MDLGPIYKPRRMSLFFITPPVNNENRKGRFFVLKEGKVWKFQHFSWFWIRQQGENCFDHNFAKSMNFFVLFSVLESVSRLLEGASDCWPWNPWSGCISEKLNFFFTYYCYVLLSTLYSFWDIAAARRHFSSFRNFAIFGEFACFRCVLRVELAKC